MALKLRNPQFKKLTETPQTKTYTVVGVSLIIVLLLTFFAIRPSISSVFAQLEKNKDKRDMLERMDKKYNNLISLSSQEQEKQAELDLLAETMPGARQEEFIEANLEKIIIDQGLSIELISFDTRQVKAMLELDSLGVNTQYAELVITVGGERTEIIRLIREIENFPRPLNIKEVSIRSADSEEERQRYDYKGDISMEIYYHKV